MSCIQKCRTFRIIEISSITSYVTLAGSAHALYPLKTFVVFMQERGLSHLFLRSWTGPNLGKWASALSYVKHFSCSNKF